MPAAARPLNNLTNAVGVTLRKVYVEQVVPERGVAIVRDDLGYTTQVPYRVQQGRGRLPKEGDYWYVDRSMGPWTFKAYITPDDDDFSTFTDPVTFTSDVAIGADLSISGNLGVGGTLTVANTTTFGDDVALDGNLGVSGNLGVGGILDADGGIVTTTVSATAVTTTGNVAVGGNLSIAGDLDYDIDPDFNETMHLTLADGNTPAIQIFGQPKALPRLQIMARGDLEWADGDNFVDTNLYRDGANRLRTDDKFISSNFPDAGWTGWTPNWSTTNGLGNPGFGNADVSCAWLRMGRLIFCRIGIAFGTTTNFGPADTNANWFFSFPINAVGTYNNLGFVEVARSAGQRCMARVTAGSNFGFSLDLASGRVDGTAVANSGVVDGITPWAWAAGDTIRGNFFYLAD